MQGAETKERNHLRVQEPKGRNAVGLRQAGSRRLSQSNLECLCPSLWVSMNTLCWATPSPPLFLTLSSPSHLRVEVTVPSHLLLPTHLPLDLTMFSGVGCPPVCVSLVTPLLLPTAILTSTSCRDPKYSAKTELKMSPVFLHHPTSLFFLLLLRASPESQGLELYF